MKVTAKREFENHPPTDDPIRAVVVDVTEPKDKQTQWGIKKKFSIVFETEMKRDDGTPWTFFSHGYTPNFDDKSNLKKDAQKIMGTSLGTEFDTEDLIGKPVKLIIEHKRDGEEVYANMTHLSAYKGDKPLAPSGQYKRQKDRDSTDTGRSYNQSAGAAPEKESWQMTKVHVGKFAGQHLENLDVDALKALITHWVPRTYDGYKDPEQPDAPPYKVTADDKRLLAALVEAKKLIDPPGRKDDF